MDELEDCKCAKVIGDHTRKLWTKNLKGNVVLDLSTLQGSLPKTMCIGRRLTSLSSQAI